MTCWYSHFWNRFQHTEVEFVLLGPCVVDKLECFRLESWSKDARPQPPMKSLSRYSRSLAAVCGGCGCKHRRVARLHSFHNVFSPLDRHASQTTVPRWLASESKSRSQQSLGPEPKLWPSKPVHQSITMQTILQLPLRQHEVYHLLLETLHSIRKPLASLQSIENGVSLFFRIIRVIAELLS